MIEESIEATLADPAEAYTFTVGSPVRCLSGMEPPPRFPLLARAWRRLTWWRQPRYEVDAIDVALGKLGLVRMRWSWLRWRWERA